MSRVKIEASTRLAAVLGWPVSHSKSPRMHNAAFEALGVDAAYLAFAISPDSLPEAIAGLRSVHCLGASVTVPHKAAVMALCDELSASASAIGAVNTLEFRSDGCLCGHNTDAPGYVRAFVHATGQALPSGKVVVLGGGGAARAVAYGVAEAGADSVQVIARTPSKVEWAQALPWESAVLQNELADCALLIDCTSIGLDPVHEKAVPAPLPLPRLPPDAIVSTLVYHRETALLTEAKTLGLQTVDGTGMLLFQGAVAFEIWTGLPAPIEVMRKALFSRPAV